MVGVNGSGKTTTTAKLAKIYQQSGKKVMIAAGDTFRAAAIDQLQVWGDRLNIPVIAGKKVGIQQPLLMMLFRQQLLAAVIF
jgi:fused signal recognition particle receptor